MPEENNPVKEAKRLAGRGDFDPPANSDDCVRCEGRNGGVPGNENMINGEPVCDYCTAQEVSYNQKIAKLVARVEATGRDFRAQVKRSKLTTCLYIEGSGDYAAYTSLIKPLFRKDFPEAYTVSSWFTPEPWASDPYMKVTISLEPERNTMKTVYQACDGKTFEDRAKAIDHETGLFESWLEGLIEGRPAPSLSTVVCHFNDSHYLTYEGDEHHMTPWDRLKESLQMYWEDAISSRLEHPKRSDGCDTK